MVDTLPTLCCGLDQKVPLGELTGALKNNNLNSKLFRLASTSVLENSITSFKALSSTKLSASSRIYFPNIFLHIRVSDSKTMLCLAMIAVLLKQSTIHLLRFQKFQRDTELLPHQILAHSPELFCRIGVTRPGFRVCELTVAHINLLPLAQ